MTTKEKKLLLDELEKALYQEFSYRKRQVGEEVILRTSYYATKMINLCNSLGLKKETQITIDYVNKLVYGG